MTPVSQQMPIECSHIGMLIVLYAHAGHLASCKQLHFIDAHESMYTIFIKDQRWNNPESWDSIAYSSITQNLVVRTKLRKLAWEMQSIGISGGIHVSCYACNHPVVPSGNVCFVRWSLYHPWSLNSSGLRVKLSYRHLCTAILALFQRNPFRIFCRLCLHALKIRVV